VHEALTCLPSYRFHSASLEMVSFNFVGHWARFKQTAWSEVINLRNVIMKVLQHGMTISEDKHFKSFKYSGNYNYHTVTTML